MTIGKERTNWFESHGTACTCADCVDRATAQRRFDNSSMGRKVGRNDRCPCGSTKKYKKCHGP